MKYSKGYLGWVHFKWSELAQLLGRWALEAYRSFPPWQTSLYILLQQLAIIFEYDLDIIVDHRGGLDCVIARITPI